MFLKLVHMRVADCQWHRWAFADSACLQQLAPFQDVGSTELGIGGQLLRTRVEVCVARRG